MKRLLLLLLVCFSSTFMLAQTPETYWIPDNVGQFNITLFAQLSLVGDVPDSYDSPVANYELGVFDQNGKCCGVAYPPTWKDQSNRWVYSLAIQGETGSTYIFKLYDHTTGQEQELSMACSEDIDRYMFDVETNALSPNYGDGCTYGYTYAPETLNFMQAQTIELTAGWNWISAYVAADDLLEQLQKRLGENGLEIWYSDGSMEYDEEYGWDGDEFEITNEEMYMVKTSAACTVELPGVPANPAGYVIDINPGWNWIGYPNTEEMSFEEALSAFEPEEGDQIWFSEGSSEYDEYGWDGDLDSFVPGEGYMYYSVSSGTKTLVFASGDAKARVLRRLPDKTKKETEE